MADWRISSVAWRIKAGALPTGSSGTKWRAAPSRRKGTYCRRLTREPGPSPVCEMEDLPLPPERAPLSPPPERTLLSPPPPERTPQPPEIAPRPSERVPQPSERAPPPRPPERVLPPSALLRESPLEAPVLLRTPARGATKEQEPREPLSKSPDLPPPEGQPLLPEREPLILACRESLRPEEENRLPSAQHIGGKPDMRGGAVFQGWRLPITVVCCIAPCELCSGTRLA
ncbi:UNVERIFIED_CONTAM: hypothetical protein FKN15_072495 [Acipenser sinensis]